MKAIIIGTSLSGKTTIIKKLRSLISIPVSEMDEELTNLNGGTYPQDSNYKNKVLVHKIIEKILSKENVLFFTNTDYFSLEKLQKAKSKGFNIIQIDVDYGELSRRNTNRVKNEGYSDSSMWLKGMLDYQKQIKGAGIVDRTIQGNKPVKAIAEEIIKLF